MKNPSFIDWIEQDKPVSNLARIISGYDIDNPDRVENRLKQKLKNRTVFTEVEVESFANMLKLYPFLFYKVICSYIILLLIVIFTSVGFISHKPWAWSVMSILILCAMFFFVIIDLEYKRYNRNIQTGRDSLLKIIRHDELNTTFIAPITNMLNNSAHEIARHLNQALEGIHINVASIKQKSEIQNTTVQTINGKFDSFKSASEEGLRDIKKNLDKLDMGEGIKDISKEMAAVKELTQQQNMRLEIFASIFTKNEDSWESRLLNTEKTLVTFKNEISQNIGDGVLNIQKAFEKASTIGKVEDRKATRLEVTRKKIPAIKIAFLIQLIIHKDSSSLFYLFPTKQTEICEVIAKETGCKMGNIKSSYKKFADKKWIENCKKKELQNYSSYIDTILELSEYQCNNKFIASGMELKSKLETKLFGI